MQKIGVNQVGLCDAGDLFKASIPPGAQQPSMAQELPVLSSQNRNGENTGAHHFGHHQRAADDRPMFSDGPGPQANPGNRPKPLRSCFTAPEK